MRLGIVELNGIRVAAGRIYDTDWYHNLELLCEITYIRISFCQALT